MVWLPQFWGFAEGGFLGGNSWVDVPFTNRSVRDDLRKVGRFPKLFFI